MGIADLVLAERKSLQKRRNKLSFPVGKAVVEPFDAAFGHRDETYSPASYGDYIVTSNEIFSAVTLRARLASTVFPRFYKGRNADKREMPDSAPAKLMEWVNPFWTQARLQRMDEICMGLWGETAWAIHYINGEPGEIWWIKPSQLLPVPDSQNYLSHYLYESNVGGQVLKFLPHEIVWLRYPNPLDEFTALSPVSAARLAADTASAMMKSNRNLHTQGMQIAGIVSPRDGRVRYSKEQAEHLADDLQTRFAGTSNAHKWAVLRYEAEFHPVNVSPKDAEWIAGLGLTLRQVGNAYGIPTPLLNDLEHATLANVREFQTALWEHGLVPDLTLRGQDIQEQYVPLFKRGRQPDYVEYDFDTVAALQKSKSETWDRERQAIEVGAMTINEWRAKKGLPSVAWGDVYWAPVNKVPTSDATAPPQQGDRMVVEGEPVDELPAAAGRFNWSALLDAMDTAIPVLNGHGVNGHGGHR